MIKKTHQELVAMVDSLMKSSACTMDFEAMIRPLEKEFPQVDIGRLIFAPPSGRQLTAAEIVDLARQGNRCRDNIEGDSDE